MDDVPTGPWCGLAGTGRPASGFGVAYPPMYAGTKPLPGPSGIGSAAAGGSAYQGPARATVRRAASTGLRMVGS